MRRSLPRVCLLILAWQLSIFASSPVIISCHGHETAEMPCCKGEHPGAICPMHQQQKASGAGLRASCSGTDLLASLFGISGVLVPEAVFEPLLFPLEASAERLWSAVSFLPALNAPPPRA